MTDPPGRPPAAMRAVLAAGGIMGEMIAARDWSASALGPMERWPQSLRTAVDLCLMSRFPSFVFWGPDLTQLTNDAVIPILGSKHPGALGRPAREVWAETWDLVGPMFAGVMANREPAYSEDMLVVLERGRLSEECFFTFCYSPISVETGEVGGVFATVTETTAEVVGARRTALLADLSEHTRTAASPAQACERAAEVFARHPVDVPFALLYLLEEHGERAVLAAVAGVNPEEALAPRTLALSTTGSGPVSCWPVGEALAGPVRVDCPDDPGLERMARAEFGPPSQALIAPITAAATDRPAGFLILGLHPGRPVDSGYRTFAGLLTGQVAAAIADASALEAARHRADQLAALDRAKTTFFANVSHELRTPLTLMLGPLEGLLADPHTPERDRLDMIHRNALRLLRHVNTLLEFTTADRRERLHLEPIDLAAFTAELASLFQPALEHGGIDLTLDCRPLPEPVWVDRQAWERIVLNLLSNAFKFTLDGEITLTVDVQHAADGQRWARIRVTDTGVGIPAEELPLIFDRFHRVEDSDSRSVEGSGIGLSLVRDLLHRHHGTIEATSLPGQGSTFTVLLPYRPAPLTQPAGDPAAEPATAAAPAVPAPEEQDVDRSAAFVSEALRWVSATRISGDPDGPVEVLIADDNADMRAHLVRILSPHWRVHAVADGHTALDVALRHPPELVLTDVMMPGLDGFALLTALREDERTRDVPVVMVSARAGTGAVIDGLDGGADDYLVKPFTTAELLARVRTHLTTARQRRAAASRLQHLADITHELNSSLDPDVVAATLARHLTPAYSQALTIEVRDGGPHAPLRPLHTTGSTPPRAPGEQDDDRLVLPLVYRDEHTGVVELTGLTTAARTGLDRPFLTAVIDRAAIALGNATSYQHEHHTALNLQTATLTGLPDVPGLALAAHYRPAAVKHLVGGDWYDAFILPATDGNRMSLAVTIGDITGHDIHAAALMSQVRNMLRQAVLDHPAAGPATAVTALEHACAQLLPTASGTLIQGQLDQDTTGAWMFTWTNAGHPRPLLLNPDGTVDQLLAPGRLIHHSLTPLPRRDHQQALPPGSTLLLFTDGLIDRPGSNYTDELTTTTRLLTELHDRPLPDLLHTLATKIPGSHPADDIALLAIHIT
ncbi:SpoIIE family protein phosphatase [Actinokineospora sp. NBRC 105648]|uniref:SpoIIE family protein phosphatase n=1 Tax=Actinokineospora sp. NBRC 105648 TaxID=3032206 RepID=UPI0025531FBE|nr:SpoIIE family protein phosphatase [Actinokineospora sp. NBRC 105648]